MDMELWQEVTVAAFLVVAGIFGFVGSFGLIKLPDPMTRLHAPTKATTLGVGGVLIASMLYFLFAQGQFSFHELMITLFLFLTAPITAHFIAKANLHTNVNRDRVSATGTDRPWAGFESDEARRLHEEQGASGK
ncbi:MAG: Na+/H+ antiporter subunit G [Paracoccaceae bacterium]|uniref:Na+/H+ antiporter subunit G n=1 Tax=Seohaeicola saemankumensis TaxID=481181 RepID=UPI001E5C3983|nr:Na+/H+ antiporter subunit G [Seohaeicola saemankumensis]MCD1625579.1 Na+/H+ antiporter subunit G [Seohaeicola saemankumensis]